MNNSVHQLNVFVDYDGLLRCRGGIDNANVPYDVEFPYLIPKTHYFRKLVVIYAQVIVLHNGVKDTLNFVRSQYSIIEGRNFVKKIIHECLICKKPRRKTVKLPRRSTIAETGC